jgi:hypothetical protein
MFQNCNRSIVTFAGHFDKKKTFAASGFLVRTLTDDDRKTFGIALPNTYIYYYSGKEMLLYFFAIPG